MQRSGAESRSTVHGAYPHRSACSDWHERRIMSTNSQQENIMPTLGICSDGATEKISPWRRSIGNCIGHTYGYRNFNGGANGRNKRNPP